MNGEVWGTRDLGLPWGGAVAGSGGVSYISEAGGCGGGGRASGQIRPPLYRPRAILAHPSRISDLMGCPNLVFTGSRRP